MATNWGICGICENLQITKPSVVWCSECDEGLCEEYIDYMEAINDRDHDGQDTLVEVEDELLNTSNVDEIEALDGSIVTFRQPEVTAQSTPMYKDRLKDLNQCETCGKVYESRPGFLSHIAMKHTQPKYVCKLCNQGFQSKTLFKAHRLRHVEEKQFKCDVCEKEYVHKKDLNAHIKAKHGNDAGYKCTKCSRVYQYAQGLQKHINAMHKEISFACAFCNARFMYKANLTRHIKINIKIEDFHLFLTHTLNNNC